MRGVYALFGTDGYVSLDKILAYFQSGDLPDVMDLNREEIERFVVSKEGSFVPSCVDVA